jgi:fructose-1,6-bisphosphatase/inositol monophosphatase family enzyme
MIDDCETIDGFLARGTSDVEEAVRKAAATEIMPRFRRLAAHEIEEKAGPHDLVTDADRNAEACLTEELSKLLPGSVVVGEEAVHADPATYEAVRGEAPVWIIDPVDGTRPFVRGDSGFCTLVALAQGGVVRASWTYAPALDRMATAIRGQGAFLDGARLRAGSPAPGRDLEVATSHPDFTTDEQKRALLGLWTEGVRPRPCGSAGLEYLNIAQGLLDATAFSWELAWDHAAGLLLVEEAGGAHLTLGG